MLGIEPPAPPPIEGPPIDGPPPGCWKNAEDPWPNEPKLGAAPPELCPIEKPPELCPIEKPPEE
jgi:hypothetical protein